MKLTKSVSNSQAETAPALLTARCPTCGHVLALSRPLWRVYEFVRLRIQADGQAPTHTEIATFCGYKSLGPVSAYLSRLVELGYVRRTGDRNRGYELVHGQPVGIVGGRLFAENGSTDGDAIEVPADVAALRPGVEVTAPEALEDDEAPATEAVAP